MGTEVVETRRRIIRRPRLTKLLDESPARIKLLIAPAGYGKTTLAQEWLSEPKRQCVWYRGGPAAADVAALAAGLSVAASEVVPEAGKRMRERLRATGHPEEDVDILAELFAEDLQPWPANAWLAIDDYQFAMESVASERFVALVTEQTSIQLVVTSRRRPAWAAARRILYGEIQEIDRRALAMDDQEARKVLGLTDKAALDLLARARGWPAVIGLAALADAVQAPSIGVPDALYRYFAEEVLQAADPATKSGLRRLALAEAIDEELAQSILGEGFAQTLREGTRLGVFVREQGTYYVHPLLREFLEMQLRTGPDAEHTEPRLVGECLLASERWDEAFDLADRFGDLPLAERVLEKSLDRLLRDGRIATIGRWLERTIVAHSDSAIFDLAEAEIAFRLGDHVKAEALAGRASLQLDDHPLASRASALAGRSALIASRERESLEHFGHAHQLAQSARDLREALVGLYFAASELGLAEARTFLAELSDLDDGSPETALRAGVARLTQATREGMIESAVAHERGTRYLVPKTSDPLASTAFLHVLANGLTLTGHYSEAEETVEELLRIAQAYRLDMPVPHALLNRALAQHGRREFGQAHTSLDAIEPFIQPNGDAYLEFTRGAIRARILTSEGRVEDALGAVRRSSADVPSPSVRAEYLGTQALVCACLGDRRRTHDLVQQAIAAFPGSVEARVLGACAVAIAEGENSERFEQGARDAWSVARQTGNLDGIVCGYRGYPPLLRQLLGADDVKPVLVDLVSRARDERIAGRCGTRIPTSKTRADELLTPRECEVMGLLRSGLSNRAIAKGLFVSESTVKVHLRHIYEKLGVRTRAEALARTSGSGHADGQSFVR